MTNTTTIFETAACQVSQDIRGDAVSYRVMSRNNVCLFEGASPAKAVEYAEWFSRKKAA